MLRRKLEDFRQDLHVKLAKAVHRKCTADEDAWLRGNVDDPESKPADEVRTELYIPIK
jgi:hypothetical protein